MDKLNISRKKNLVLFLNNYLGHYKRRISVDFLMHYLLLAKSLNQSNGNILMFFIYIKLLYTCFNYSNYIFYKSSLFLLMYSFQRLKKTHLILKFYQVNSIVVPMGFDLVRRICWQSGNFSVFWFEDQCVILQLRFSKGMTINRYRRGIILIRMSA